jgi:phosphate-selective porin
VDGGSQRGITAGLNWYPNDLIRFMLDYNHINYDKENGTKVTGANLGVPIGAKFDAIAFRGQVAF